MGRKRHGAARLALLAAVCAAFMGCHKSEETKAPAQASSPAHVVPVPPPPPPAAPAADASGTAAAPGAAPGAAPAPSDRNLAAHVNLVDGSAQVVTPDKSVRPLEKGDPVYEGDSILTSDNSEVHLDMADGGFIAVRPNTAINIAQFQANGDASDHSVIGLVKGGLRSITGWIGHTYPQNYSIVTPGATIGVRGTDHEPTYLPEATGDTEAGTYDHVYEGASRIVTPQGAVDVAPGHAGFVDHSGRGPPRILAHVPHFLEVPHRHDSVFVGKHAQVMATLDARRQARALEHAREPVRGNQGLPRPAPVTRGPGGAVPGLAAPHHGTERENPALEHHEAGSGAKGIDHVGPGAKGEPANVREMGHSGGAANAAGAREEGRTEAHPTGPGMLGQQRPFARPMPGASMPGQTPGQLPGQASRNAQATPNARPNLMQRLFPNLQRPGTTSFARPAPAVPTQNQNGVRPGAPNAPVNPFFPRAQVPQVNPNARALQPAQRTPVRPQTPPKKPENEQ